MKSKNTNGAAPTVAAKKQTLVMVTNHLSGMEVIEGWCGPCPGGIVPVGGKAVGFINGRLAKYDHGTVKPLTLRGAVLALAAFVDEWETKIGFVPDGRLSCPYDYVNHSDPARARFYRMVADALR
jgi:hypothetical protein